MVNCSSLRQLDFMDGHPGPYPGHACFNIPPVLAMAEYLDATGSDTLLALVLGYEVNIRLQLSAGTPEIGSWSGSTNLGIASAVGMGKLLGLSADQLAHAIAISTTHAPALDAPGRDQMPESKTCMDGLVAASAVTSVFLAKAGITGPAKVFEGEGGYKEGISIRLDTDLLLGPFDRFRIMDVYTKRYNGVKCAQTAVAAALKAAAQLPNGWRDIERLELGFAERDYTQQMRDEAARRRPTSRDTANHSAVYCTAIGMIDGDLGPAQFEEDRLHNPDVLGLVDRIQLTSRPELNSYWPAANPSHVRIQARDGRTVEEVVYYSPGHSKNPLSDEQLQGKFRGLASEALGQERCDEVIRLSGQLAELASIRPLMDALIPAREAQHAR
jgi:2-methylcitrate dehydratase